MHASGVLGDLTARRRWPSSSPSSTQFPSHERSSRQSARPRTPSDARPVTAELGRRATERRSEPGRQARCASHSGGAPSRYGCTRGRQDQRRMTREAPCPAGPGQRSPTGSATGRSALVVVAVSSRPLEGFRWRSSVGSATKRNHQPPLPGGYRVGGTFRRGRSTPMRRTGRVSRMCRALGWCLILRRRRNWLVASTPVDQRRTRPVRDWSSHM